MDRLNEAELRRAGFVEGEPITLADGQAWHFPRPDVWLVRDRSPAGYAYRSDFGDEYAELLNRYENTGTGREFIGLQLAIAEALILRNYDLTLEQVQELVRFRYRGDEPDATRDAIMKVGLGLADPKGGP